MTDDRLTAIRERADKATPGPWVSPWGREWPKDALNCDGHNLAVTEDDAELIAHAREDVPYLLGVIAALSAEAALGRAVREAIGDSPMLPQILLQHANGAHWFVHDILVTIANWYEQHP